VGLILEPEVVVRLSHLLGVATLEFKIGDIARKVFLCHNTVHFYCDQTLLGVIM
jgi:hypothetical protein